MPYASDVYAVYADNTATPYTTYKPTDDGTSADSNSAAEPPEESMGPLVPGPSMSSTRASAGDDPFDFHTRARSAFSQGDYRQATYMAAHAVVDEPKNPKVHLLYSLGMFALGEYRGAAMEAHAVVSLGQTPDWAAIYAFYGSVEPYTNQLRTLEKYVRDHRKSPEGRFLLGYHYLTAGHPEEAKVELLEALKLAPRDRVAAKLLKEAGGTIPPEIAKQLTELPAPDAPKSVVPEPPKPQLPPTK
ncbi:MAG: hypothetical protein ABFC63_02360 [Thermoguttaceae bacterium]